MRRRHILAGLALLPAGMHTSRSSGQMILAAGGNAKIVSNPAPGVQASVERSRDFLLAQARTRSVHRSSVLVPDDPTINRTSAGEWSGTFTLPSAQPSLPHTPIFLTGPLFFPLVANRPATFMGLVDAPFGSMTGWAGIRMMKGSISNASPVDDPSTQFADGGANWGSYFVVGSVDKLQHGSSRRYPAFGPGRQRSRHRRWASGRSSSSPMPTGATRRPTCGAYRSARRGGKSTDRVM